MTSQIMLLFPILVPIVFGVLVGMLKMEDRKKRNTFVLTGVSLTLALTVFAVVKSGSSVFTLAQVSPGIYFGLSGDGLGKIFALLIAVLWVITTFYAFGYMEKEGKEVRFYTFYLIALGVTLGLAFSANALTLYLFYELLTLTTYPLVIHAETPEALEAGKKYLIYSFIGAVLVFISVAVAVWAGATNFSLTANLLGAGNRTLLTIAYFIGFIGFGVKAAVVPMQGWLLSVYIAPTPVTALLHAVAVVKAGVFGIMRLTYYIYGVPLLKGSWAQIVAVILTAITIIYGSTMALRERHLKKRLAYSTVSQLSYIVFAVVIMSPAGLSAGITHMVFHALMKMTLFFCCGNIMFTTGTTQVDQMDGYGQKMPTTFVCFLIASLALVGLPPTVGLISKWQLALAGLNSDSGLLGLVGVGAIIVSALLTALYLLPLSAKAFFPGKDRPLSATANTEAPKTMTVPILLLTISIVFFGVVPGLILTPIQGIGGQLAQYLSTLTL